MAQKTWETKNFFGHLALNSVLLLLLVAFSDFQYSSAWSKTHEIFCKQCSMSKTLQIETLNDEVRPTVISKMNEINYPDIPIIFTDAVLDFAQYRALTQGTKVHNFF